MSKVKAKIKKICKCGKKFEVQPCFERRKFCSRKCFGKYRDMSWVKVTNLTKICQCGKEFRVYPYEKDTRISCSRSCASKFMKRKTGYKSPKGSLAKLGNKNPNFGKFKENPGYCALHNYIKRIFPKPIKCAICNEEKKLELSSKKHSYTRNIKDWWWLCKKCHHHYDGNEKYLIYGRKLRKKPRIIINCLNCKKEIKILKSKLPRKKFCSRRCNRLYMNYYHEKQAPKEKNSTKDVNQGRETIKCFTI